MAISLESRIGDLVSEFLAHAFRFGRPLAAARAISARFFEPFLHNLYDFRVFVKSDFHTSPREQYTTKPPK